MTEGGRMTGGGGGRKIWRREERWGSREKVWGLRVGGERRVRGREEREETEIKVLRLTLQL